MSVVGDPADLLEQTQWDFFWVPGDVGVVDRPELLYAYCPRDVLILNAVNRTRAEPERLPALIAEVQAAHSGVRSRWLVRHEAEFEPLRAALAAAGYAPALELEARAFDLRQLEPERQSDFEIRPVLDRRTLLDCMQVLSIAFPGDREFTEEEVEGDLRNCTQPGALIHRFVAYDRESGTPVSSGGMTWHPTLRLCYLWAGGTVPQARRRGAYTTIVQARLRRARDLGCDFAGLYAMVDSSAPIVAKQGFGHFGGMSYWER